MITNISLVTLYCLDQDQARDFYVDKLGFQSRADVSTPDGFRWVTVSHPNQPELEITFMKPGPPLEPDAAEFIRGQLEGGKMGNLALQVDDCRKTFEELSAKGVTFRQGPEDRPYGVEAIMLDNSGNWLSLTERKDYKPEDFD